MLYPKNSERELSDELFANPTCEYRGAPFWAWNCKLSREELIRQIDILHEMGFGGFHMHVRSGMDTVYLGDEFMGLVSDCVDKAKKEKMLAWLYDEDRWPSGFAGGYVTRDKQYRMRYLLLTTKPYQSSGESGTLHSNEQNIASRGGTDSKLIARFNVRLRSDGCLDSYELLSEGEEGMNGAVWYAYVESPRPNPRYNGYTYVNTLDKKSVDRFIETTHEAYKKSIGTEFGKTVPAIFTDEPQTTFKNTLKFAADKSDVTLPWTDDINDSFTAAYGMSLTEHIPELLWELPDGEISRVRYYYHDHISERFASAFADNIGQWCKENGIMLTGHMMKEPTLTTQTQAVGEAMRSYRNFGMPGIDMLAYRREFTTAKQAQSAVNQMGCEGMLDELYGVTTWDFDFRGHKLYGDWQAALGVSVRVPHLSWVSMEGEAKRDYPASINYQSPWYHEYSYIENHFARINTAMTRGKPVVKVGVIHPIESYWLHWGPSEQTALVRETLDKNFSDVTEWLLFGGIDFDFICESTLPRFCEKGDNPLRVGKMSYDAIIVPACETLRKSTFERLDEFCRAGGRLIFMGDAPRLLDAVPSEMPLALYRQAEAITFGRGALLTALEKHRTVELRNANGALCSDLLYRMREDNGMLWLFIAKGRDPYNKDISNKQKIFIKLRGEYSVTLYDTVNGEITPAKYSHSDGFTVIPAVLYQNDSLLLKLVASITVDNTEAPAYKAEENNIAVPYSVKFKLDEPNALMLDNAEWSLDNEPFSPGEEILRIDTAVRTRLGMTPWGGAADQPWYMPKHAAEHTLKLRYEFDSETALSTPLLAIENPEVAEIYLNSEKADSEPVGWYVDKSIKTIKLPPIRQGSNLLEIVIPYGERTAAERVYILGEFGVRIFGSRAVITELPEKLAFGSIVGQGLPFYSGKLTYKFVVKTDGGRLAVTVPQYRASVLRVTAGKQSKLLAFSPYTVDFELEAGNHEIEIDAYIPRTNGFGPIHCCDDKLSYQSPGAWRTTGDSWSYEYRLTDEGILTSPKFIELSL